MSDSSFGILDQILKGSSDAANFTVNAKLQQIAAAKQAAAVAAARQRGYAKGQQSVVVPGMVNGKGNTAQAYNYFIQKGLSPQAASGILGNLMAESSIDPTSNQEGGPGRGIAQWSEGGRWDTYLKQLNGGDPNSLTNQLDFLWKELQGGYRPVLNDLQDTNKVRAATKNFLYNYEIPADQSKSVVDYRTGLSRNIYQRMQDMASGSAARQQGATGTSTGYGKWMNPLQNMPANTSSGYGYRINPITGERSFHEGADYAAALGTPIQAAMGGKIIQSGWDPIYGHQIIVRNNGIQTMYGHLSHINHRFDQGDFVNPGQRLGRVGSTGWSTGPHLHFGVYEGGQSVNPSEFFNGELRQGWAPQLPDQQGSPVSSSVHKASDYFSHVLQQLGL